MEKDGTRQKGCEKDALGRKKSFRAASCSSGVPLHRAVMTPAISLTGDQDVSLLICCCDFLFTEVTHLDAPLDDSAVPAKVEIGYEWHDNMRIPMQQKEALY